MAFGGALSPRRLHRHQHGARAENVVAFYNKRGTCEQYIKEGKGAIKWTRLSCRSFAANAARLQLHALAYNLGNFLRTLATPEPIKEWSLTTLQGKADQNRREGRRSRPLCRLPDGGGRHSARPVLGHLADDRRTSATTGRIDGVARLVVTSSIETTGEVRLDDRKYDIFRGST